MVWGRDRGRKDEWKQPGCGPSLGLCLAGTLGSSATPTKPQAFLCSVSSSPSPRVLSGKGGAEGTRDGLFSNNSALLC